MALNDSETTTALEKRPLLLELPGELKNRIYRLVLQSDTRVLVTSNGHERPALLNACKEIRREALKIFYHENSFNTETRDYDSESLMRWTEVTKRLAADTQDGAGRWHLRIHYRFGWVPSWTNLVQWLRRVHAGEIFMGRKSEDYYTRSIRQVSSQRPWSMTVAGMFDMVLQLRSQGWRLVESILQSQRQVLISIDHQWDD